MSTFLAVLWARRGTWGGGEGVTQGRSMRLKLCTSLGSGFRLVGANVNGCQGMSDAIAHCTRSYPSPKPTQILRVACTLVEPSCFFYYYYFLSFTFSVCFGGGG
jgi:hypothetical protein